MQHLIKRMSLGMVLASFAAALFAAPINSDQLQTIADRYLKNHHMDEHLSGLALSVYDTSSQKLVTVYSGTTCYDCDQPVNATNIFPIGSITKSFTAAIILQLESDPNNHFSIDDPIDKYFPQYSNWHGVTSRQLMNMTSGIMDHSSDKTFYQQFAANPSKEWQPQELVDFSYQHKLLYQPGNGWNYSNTNYILLGMLIEKLTGHSLTDEYNNRLINPLHLQHTFYVAHLASAQLQPYLVHGYDYSKFDNRYFPMGSDTTNVSLSIFGAAGGMVATSDDVAQWVQALFMPGKVLSAEQLNKMTSLVSTKTGKPIDKLTAKVSDGFGLGITEYFDVDTQEYIFNYEGMTYAGRAFYVYDPTNGRLASATLNSALDDEQDHIGRLVWQGYALSAPGSLEGAGKMVNFDGVR